MSKKILLVDLFCNCCFINDITVAPVLSGHLWDNDKLAAKDRWPLIPGFKLIKKKQHRVFSFWLYCTDLLIAYVMAAYTEMVHAQLGLMNKKFKLILNDRFNSMYLSKD